MALRPASTAPTPGPFTHHQILEVAAPFTRAGHGVDLAASDRLARRLAFKPVVHEDLQPGGAPVTVVMQLENPAPDRWRLTRQLTVAEGLVGSLVVEGADVTALLARVAAVPLQCQYGAGPGWLLVRSHKLLAGTPGHEARMRVLTHGEVRVEGLTMKLRVSPVKGIPGEVELSATGEHTLALPEDLMAVLGWHWARLIKSSAGWSTRVRLRGGGTERGLDAETKLDRAAAHLAQTLAEPPAHFHDKQVAARWRVVLRRAMPLLGAVAMMVGAAGVARLDLAQESIFRMLIFHSPPIILIAFFCMNELPRVEIPPWPRRPQMPSWRVPRTNPAP